ncbi:MAG: TonB-dependent receptor [Pseudomonadota bacterium]
MNSTNRIKKLLGTTLIAAAMMGGAPLGAQTAGDAQQITIPAQSLASALARFNAETGLQVVAPAELTRNRSSAVVDGVLTPEAALSALLAGTGLSYEVTSGGSYLITPAPEAPLQADGPVTLNTLTVTARRFEESLQDVPGSVLVLPDEEIERSNITDLDDIVLRAPNVNSIEGGAPTDAQLSIRGLSNLISASGTGPTNGVYIDEVIINPTGRNTGLNPTLVDLERVEVLYGPQGTTYGRGTIGGAINYVTKKPTEAFEASIEGQAASFPDGRIRGMVNGPILDNNLLNGRVTFFAEGANSFLDTPNLPDNEGLDTSDFGGRIALRSQPNDRLTIDFSATYERNNYVDSNTATEESIEAGERLLYLPNEEGDFSVDRFLTALRADYETGFGTASSITSFFIVEEDGVGDGDVSALDALVIGLKNQTRSIGQEFRFASDKLPLPYLGPTSFTVGTNFSFNRDQSENFSLSGSTLEFLFGGPGALTAESERNVTNFAVFGDVIFEPVERLELGAGVRFNLDHVEFEQSDTTSGVFLLLGGDPTSQFSDSETFTGISPKGSLTYSWTDDLSTYVTISTGYRSGGFNSSPNPVSQTFEEEKAINYEGGFRSGWLDNKVIVNGSGFATFYKDLQVFSNVPTIGLPITIIDNAAKARSIGAEISLRTFPIEGLFLGVDYGLAKTKFVEFEDSLVGDITGERLPNAPVHTFSLTGEYAHPVLDDTADAFFRTEYSYTSSFFNGVGDSIVAGEDFGSRNIINLRTGLRSENLEVELFIENLLDELYQTGETSGIVASLLGTPRQGEVGPPRHFGLRARVLF